MGCYPVSFFNLFCKKNEELKLIKSKSTLSFTGVDDESEAEISIGKNILASCKVSLKRYLDNSCTIYGKKGIINIPSPWLPAEKSYIEVIKGNSYYKKFTSTPKSIYSIQIENVSNSFSKKDDNIHQLVNINESIKIMKVLDMWKENLL